MAKKAFSELTPKGRLERIKANLSSLFVFEGGVQLPNGEYVLSYVDTELSDAISSDNPKFDGLKPVTLLGAVIDVKTGAKAGESVPCTNKRLIEALAIGQQIPFAVYINGKGYPAVRWGAALSETSSEEEVEEENEEEGVGLL